MLEHNAMEYSARRRNSRFDNIYWMEHLRLRGSLRRMAVWMLYIYIYIFRAFLRKRQVENIEHMYLEKFYQDAHHNNSLFAASSTSNNWCSWFFQTVNSITHIIGNDLWNITISEVFGTKLYYKNHDLVGDAVGHYVSYSTVPSVVFLRHLTETDTANMRIDGAASNLT